MPTRFYATIRGHCTRPVSKVLTGQCLEKRYHALNLESDPPGLEEAYPASASGGFSTICGT